MINLGAGPALFALTGYLYWGLMLVLIVLALAFGKRPVVRLVLVLVIATAFIQYPARHVIKRNAEVSDLKAKREMALAYWRERCKGAGLIIHRTVADVDGLFIGEVPLHHTRFMHDPNAPDPYNWDFEGDDFIRSLLTPRSKSGQALDPGKFDPKNPKYDESGSLIPEPIARPGFRWVEGVDPIDGQRHHYTLVFTTKTNGRYMEAQIQREPPAREPPRYAIQARDISTARDREMWVAGGSLKVIDLHTGEILAERIGFMVDEWQGSSANQRFPWQEARKYRCPSPISDNPLRWPSNNFYYQTRLFVEMVLKIRGDEK